MKCPRCNSRKLWIVIEFSGYVLCESSDEDDVRVCQTASLNSDWNADCPCQCAACHWEGKVVETQETLETQRCESFSAGSATSSTGGTGVEAKRGVASLIEVQRRLKTQPCPVTWSECIRFLMARAEEHEELTEKYAELVQAIKKAKRKKSSGSDHGDTTIT